VLHQIEGVEPEEVVAAGVGGQEPVRNRPVGLVAEHRQVHEVAVHHEGLLQAAVARYPQDRLAEVPDHRPHLRPLPHLARRQVAALVHQQQVHVAAARTEVVAGQGAHQGDAPEPAGAHRRVGGLQGGAGAFQQVL